MNSSHPKLVPSARTALLRALLPLATLSAAGAARAELIAYESFNTYTTNAVLNGQTGGSGWSTAWVSAPGATVDDVAITTNGGRSLRLSGSHDQALRREIPRHYKGRDIYVSFRVQFIGGPGTAGSQIPAGATIFSGWQALDSIPDRQIDSIGVVGLNGRVGARIRESNTPMIGASNQTLKFGTTYHVAIKYIWKPDSPLAPFGPGEYGSVRVWLDPSGSAETAQSSSITVQADAPVATDGSNDCFGLLVRTFFSSNSYYQHVDDIRIGTTWKDVVTTPPSDPTSREPELWPFHRDSLWNTPIGSGIQRGGTNHELAVALNSIKGQLNYKTYTTPIHMATSADPLAYIQQVATGTWKPYIGNRISVRAPSTITLSGDMNLATITYQTNGNITFVIPDSTAKPDGFMAFINKDDNTVTESFKTCRSGMGEARTLIARHDSVSRLDLLGDGFTATPIEGTSTRRRAARASGLSFTAGLIRKHEFTKAQTDPKNAIPHALAMALTNSQLLRPPAGKPGYQWPARGVDGDASTAYTGKIPMGTQFVLEPSFNIEGKRTDGTDVLSPAGKALAYALRDYGAYVTDRSGYTTLYAEHGIADAVAEPMKTDWQNTLLKHMVPVTNNITETGVVQVGGPGLRLRPPAPAFAN